MPQLKQIQEEFIDSVKQLHSADEAVELYWLSVEHVLGINRLTIKTNPSFTLTHQQHNALNDILVELKNGRPLQHIIGYSWFLGRKFMVNESVLIPRPETEELVMWVLDDIQAIEKPQTPFHILDIGTGSGCIAISLKKKSSIKAQVHAIDISPDALQVAKENATALKADINFLQLDILEAERYVNELNQKFHVIVSNPPYITTVEKEAMHQNVLDHEPHSALFVDDENPLLFYKAIAFYALSNLHEGGTLYFEINQHRGEELIDWLAKNGFTDIILKKDISGNDRMIRATRA